MQSRVRKLILIDFTDFITIIVNTMVHIYVIVKFLSDSVHVGLILWINLFLKNYNIQLLNFAYKRLLNKPYEN